MKRMMFAGLAFAAMASMSLAGCAAAPLGSVINAIGTVETVTAAVNNVYVGAPKTLFVARAGYDIVLTTAATFKAATCPAVDSQPYCATLIPKLRTADKAVKIALDAADAFVKANPSLNPSAVISAVEKATAAFAAIEDAYKVPLVLPKATPAAAA